MDNMPLPPPPPLPAAPPPPAAESTAPSAVAATPPSLLPYVVAVVSVAVLGAVAWLLFAQPRRARMAIDEVIVLDGPAPAPAATAAPAAAEQPPSAVSDSPRQPLTPTPPAAAPSAAATTAAAPAAEPAPGDVLEAELTGEGSSGDGFVQIGGLTVYVAGGRKGERVRFRIREVKTSRKGNRYAQAERCAPADAPAEGGAP